MPFELTEEIPFGLNPGEQFLNSTNTIYINKHFNITRKLFRLHNIEGKTKITKDFEIIFPISYKPVGTKRKEPEVLKRIIYFVLYLYLSYRWSGVLDFFGLGHKGLKTRPLVYLKSIYKNPGNKGK